MNEQIILAETAFRRYVSSDYKAHSNTRCQNHTSKVIVLDDDPTGTQTVHGISVYTDWSLESIRKGFLAPQKLFYVLTNSRSFSRKKTETVHREIARNIAQVAQEMNQTFLLVSRGDSTLRGHYPLETETLRDELEKQGLGPFDGEVIVPFLPEGGRYTMDDIHYVQMGDKWIPVGQTEFAKDKTFGFCSSNLREWVEEKTGGVYQAKNVLSLSIEQLRSGRVEETADMLCCAQHFQRIIVNAISYGDIQMFVASMELALARGKHFIFRSAAALTKVLGGIEDRELLSREELISANRNGGLIVVGSHVQKTTTQLKRLEGEQAVQLIEFDIFTVFDEAALRAEMARVLDVVESGIACGKTIVLYTSRTLLSSSNEQRETSLQISVRISEAIAEIVHSLKVRPSFIIAKGGITSSDVATKGLGIKSATVIGQIIKGVPVWKTGIESKFTDMIYVVFPGNVGDENALYDAFVKVRP